MRQLRKFNLTHGRLPNPEKPEDQQYRKGFTMDPKDVAPFKRKWGIFGAS